LADAKVDTGRDREADDADSNAVVELVRERLRKKDVNGLKRKIYFRHPPFIIPEFVHLWCR
jgi:hypothetical protein